MTPSTILRRLGSESTKNKLYFAFRELGRVIRTLFLLKYLNDPELRRAIHAATNKVSVAQGLDSNRSRAAPMTSCSFLSRTSLGGRTVRYSAT